MQEKPTQLQQKTIERRFKSFTNTEFQLSKRAKGEGLICSADTVVHHTLGHIFVNARNFRDSHKSNYFLCPISFGVIYRGKFKYCLMCPKSSQLAAAMSLIFCVDLGCTWDGHGWLWKHIQFAVTPWLLPFPIIWRAKNITSASFTATIQENEAKWHMSFLTFCFQIKITPKRWRQLCRLILSKRQIKVWGFQKCNQKKIFGTLVWV